MPREEAAVEVLQALEAPVDGAREDALLAVRPEERRRHHRRERQGDDARDEDRRRQGEGELAEERAGETALEADRRVDRRERDRHRDDRTDELACAFDGCLERGLAVAHVTLNILDDDDRVVDDETDREHDREEGEQVDREPEHLHQEDGANEARPGSRRGGRAIARKEPRNRKMTTITMNLPSRAACARPRRSRC